MACEQDYWSQMYANACDQDLFAACDDKNAMGGNGIPALGTLFAWQRRLAEKRA